MTIKLGRALVSGVLLATMMVSQVFANELSATLDGKRIRIDRVPELNCHDFDYPVIRCFSTAELIAADLEARMSAGDAAGARLLEVGYVTIYQNIAYSCPCFNISNGETSLSSIGWNDRISSFISHGASGGFWEHSPSGGFYYGYASTTEVYYVGDFYNDKFSAFSIN